MQLEMLSKVPSADFVEEWYESAEENHFWMQWRFLAFLHQIESSNISLTKPLNVLDIGAGNGVLRDQLEAHSEWKVDCADLNHQALKVSKPGRGRLLFYNILERRQEFKNHYDLVCVFDVIEHLEDPETFLQAALDHLKPGGHLCINVPAFQTLFSHYDTMVGHIRRYNQSSLEGEISKMPVSVIDKRYWGFSLVPVLILRKLWLALTRPDVSQTVKSGFHPPAKFVNSAFNALGKMETQVIRRAPLGTSLLLIAQKR